MHEALHPAAARDRADVHLWLPEYSVGRRKEHVRHQCEFAPVSELRIYSTRGGCCG